MILHLLTSRIKKFSSRSFIHDFMFSTLLPLIHFLLDISLEMHSFLSILYSGTLNTNPISMKTGNINKPLNSGSLLAYLSSELVGNFLFFSYEIQDLLLRMHKIIPFGCYVTYLIPFGP